MQPFDAYEPCGSCQRHVKWQDAACPFCGAARRATPPTPTPTRGIRNISRAQWLAFGSTLLGMGCNGALGSSGGDVGQHASPAGSTAMTAPATTSTSSVGPGGQDAAPAVDATDESAGNDDATVAQEAGAGTWGPPDASCPRHGSFACGSSECDRATQFCSGQSGGANKQCEPLTNLNLASDSGTCGTCPTCDCIPPGYGATATGACSGWQVQSCFQDNFGGLTVTCQSMGACYGSPPARLDRTPSLAVG